MTLKKGEKGLKNASFLAINSKKKFAPPPPAANLFVGENIFKRGRGGMITMHNIYPCHVTNIVIGHGLMLMLACVTP